MYHGKIRKHSRRSGKSVALLVSVFLLLTVTVGGTIAFLVDSDGPLTNLFAPSRVTTGVVETLSGTTKKDVKIQNTGDTDAWIRAAVVVTWQDENGNVYGQAPVAGTDYTITYDLSNGWKQGDDGFYYWTKPVAPNNLTGVLIASSSALQKKTVSTGDETVTYYLSVEIIASGIQSKPARVFNEEWKSSGLTVVDNDGDGNELAPDKWVLE